VRLLVKRVDQLERQLLMQSKSFEEQAVVSLAELHPEKYEDKLCEARSAQGLAAQGLVVTPPCPKFVAEECGLRLEQCVELQKAMASSESLLDSGSASSDDGSSGSEASDSVMLEDSEADCEEVVPSVASGARVQLLIGEDAGSYGTVVAQHPGGELFYVILDADRLKAAAEDVTLEGSDIRDWCDLVRYGEFKVF
jgi:hypothetical protein